MKLEIAFNELHQKEKMEELWFWGKIIGIEADYYIALGVNYTGHYEFPQKLFYYTSSATYVFEALPETNESHLVDIQKHNITFITGKPTTILEKYEEETDDLDNQAVDDKKDDDIPADDQNPDQIKENLLDDTIEIAEKPAEKKKNFTELSRLTFLVKNIDYDTNVVPQGAYRLLPIHELRKNESFKGLRPEELTDLNKFHHFRNISDPEKKNIIESDEAIFRYDFLDSISNDAVKGSWTIQLDSTKNIV